MKRKRRVSPLARIPMTVESVHWETDEAGRVTLLVENAGWANRLAQRLFRRPRHSRVLLDVLGSYVWRQIDGRRSVARLGELVETQFGETAHPLYERLYGYLQVLHSYGFVRWA